MSKRVLLLVPENLTFDMLTEEQQAAIARVFGQYVMPMPETVPKDGTKIVDAIVNDSFDPANMAAAGFDWQVLGVWSDDETIIQPLDKVEFTARLAPVVTYDEQGSVLDTKPAEFHEPHRWFGWKEWEI